MPKGMNTVHRQSEGREGKQWNLVVDNTNVQTTQKREICEHH